MGGLGWSLGLGEGQKVGWHFPGVRRIPWWWEVRAVVRPLWVWLGCCCRAELYTEGLWSGGE